LGDLIFSSFSARVAMLIVDDEEEKNRKRAGEAVLAVMEKTREKKKRYSGILAELSISIYGPPPSS
jgi:hypothetical protein